LPDGRRGSLVPTGAHEQALAHPDAYLYAEDPGGFDPKAYLSVLLRWRWLFLSILAATVIAAAAWASFQTPLYRATATLELNPAPTQVVQTDGDQPQDKVQADRDFLSLQLGLIKSRSLAEQVARALNLARDKAFLGHDPKPGEAADDAVEPLMDHFSASGTSSDRIMEVSFVHPDPNVAARVANAFADQAIESNFDRAYAATARSRQFLQKRLDATRRDLESSERALIDYARQAKIINVVAGDQPTSGDSAGGTLVASNLVALNQQLADAQNARIVAQQKYAQATAAAQSATEADATVQALRQQRAQLQAQYEEKSQLFKPTFPEMVALKARIDGLDKQIANSGSQASSAVRNSLRADMIAAQNREHALQARINQLQSKFLDLNDRGVKYTILKRSVDANRSMYNALLQQLGVENSSATRTSGISVIDKAEPPKTPFSPNIPRTLILALLGGLVLGSAGAFGADRFFDRINTPEDAKLLNLPLLGVIPLAAKGEMLDDMIADPRSPISEAFHSTRAALQYATPGGTPKSILFTSPQPGEGKTSSTIAIAADLVSVGKRIVVIDADLRKPALHGDSPGLSAVLAGKAGIGDVLVPTDSPRLWLLPAGRLPPNPTTLLTGRGMAQLIQSLGQQFDNVIIDGPPVMGFADAPLIAAVTEATIMVLESGRTSRVLAMNAVTRVEATGGALIGTILNKYDRKVNGFSYSGYGYYDYDYSGAKPKRELIAPPAAEDIEPSAAEAAE
jgi:capsular exopolysaccharide synthesis family protein